MSDGTYGRDYHAVHLPDHPARRGVWQVVARHLDPWIPPSAEVLEIGAGYCHWINAVRAARRVAVDLWEELPRHAAPGVEPLRLDISSALETLGAGRFAAVLASNVLEHFEPDAAAGVARGVRDVLRPGGRFLIIQPNFRYAFRNYFDDYTHRAVFTDVSLPTMLRAQGFAIDEVRPKFLPYSMRDVRTTVPGWLVAAYLRSPFKPRAGQMLVVARRP